MVMNAEISRLDDATEDLLADLTTFVRCVWTSLAATALEAPLVDMHMTNGIEVWFVGSS